MVGGNMKYRVPIEVERIKFELIITDSYEVILNRVSVELDEMKQPKCGVERDKVCPTVGSIVYRKAVRECLNWIYKEKPPILCWSIGGDYSRISLYSRFARYLAKIGYKFETEDNNKFYCYRI